ncbi:alpha/beta fold hydrolase [Microbacterium sp. NPDC057659]|uniref:alpha/beta fold hydrolase n=1 Tax=Microbacterium sp. NPDC057659 TaxID=3346198 RepID=UPI00366CECD5
MAENSIFEADGRSVSYVDEGPGPVALVLIPGVGMDGGALGSVGHYLAEEAGFRVLRVGARSDDSTVAERVEDALAVMDHVGLDDAWIGGHGAGGTVARVFAGEHTDRVNGLLLLGVEENETPLAPAIPILIIQGTEDVVTPPANGVALQATATDRASITSIQGADHFFPMTHPIETAVVIEEYLDWD